MTLRLNKKQLQTLSCFQAPCHMKAQKSITLPIRISVNLGLLGKATCCELQVLLHWRKQDLVGTRQVARQECHTAGGESEPVLSCQCYCKWCAADTQKKNPSLILPTTHWPHNLKNSLSNDCVTLGLDPRIARTSPQL